LDIINIQLRGAVFLLNRRGLFSGTGRLQQIIGSIHQALFENPFTEEDAIIDEHGQRGIEADKKTGGKRLF
jgi:hypothetical protein